MTWLTSLTGTKIGQSASYAGRAVGWYCVAALRLRACAVYQYVYRGVSPSLLQPVSLPFRQTLARYCVEWEIDKVCPGIPTNPPSSPSSIAGSSTNPPGPCPCSTSSSATFEILPSRLALRLSHARPMMTDYRLGRRYDLRFDRTDALSGGMYADGQ